MPAAALVSFIMAASVSALKYITKGDQTQGQKQEHRYPEGLAHLIASATQGTGLADQLGHGHRRAGSGDGQQDLIDIIGVGKVGVPLLPNDIDQGIL